MSSHPHDLVEITKTPAECDHAGKMSYSINTRCLACCQCGEMVAYKDILKLLPEDRQDGLIFDKMELARMMLLEGYHLAES